MVFVYCVSKMDIVDGEWVFDEVFMLDMGVDW